MNMSIHNSMIHPQSEVYPDLENSQQFLEEVRLYLEKYPETEHVDVCLHDLNGHLRGKRIDIKTLNNLAKGCYFPLSIYGMSLDGNVVEETGLGKYIGEPDRLCMPVPGTLKPCALQPETHAQVYVSMQNENGSDCLYEPRNQLKKIIRQFNKINIFPIMGSEIEFYLFENQSTPSSTSQNISQCFDVDAPDDYKNVLQQIEIEAKRQKIEMTAIVAESASGQYEINLQHTRDILKLCDDIFAMKRIVKQIATSHGLNACFMAKPDMDKAGSGLHFHMSLQDQDDKNIFSHHDIQQPNPTLTKVLAGLLDLMPASMAILAPNINSYRRFQFGSHVPLEANWGINNRNVAIRLPCTDQENQRLEYRVAGADSNCYLCCAVILIGVLHGLQHDFILEKPSHLKKLNDSHNFLPIRQLEALHRFEKNLTLKKYLGEDFVRLWLTCKRHEYEMVQNHITDIEIGWNI